VDRIKIVPSDALYATQYKLQRCVCTFNMQHSYCIQHLNYIQEPTNGMLAMLSIEFQRIRAGSENQKFDYGLSNTVFVSSSAVKQYASKIGT